MIANGYRHPNSVHRTVKFLAVNCYADVQEVFDQINKLEKAEYNEAFFSDYEDRFQFFVLAALLLILSEALIADRKGRLAGKIKLFSNSKSNR